MISVQEYARLAALPDATLLAECEASFFVASGPGGQHRNKTESGVRLTHRTTGITVTATERRSQFQNRSAALERLRAILVKRSHVDAPRVATRPTKGAKRRRLEGKRLLAQKKQSRRSDWD
jgi:protein subunit release factor B